MTQTISYMEAVVGADITSFRRGMQEVRRETGILSDQFSGLGGVASRVGRDMTLAISAPIIAGLGAAVKAASDFDGSMRNINSVIQVSEEALASISAEVLRFGATTRTGAQEASEALNTVFQAGIEHVPTAMAAMQVGLKTSEAGLADITKTTEGLIATMLTFGDQSPETMKRISDATTLAVQVGVGSMDKFITGFGNAMGTAAAVGDSFESMQATIAFLSQRGLDAAAAGTMLNNAYTKLLKPGTELVGIFNELGVASGRELIQNFGGFEGALRAIYGVIGTDENMWAKLFPDARGFKAVSRLFTAFEEDGQDIVSAYFDNFTARLDEGGVTQAAWEQQMMSFPALMGRFESALQALAITIGQILLPVLAPLLENLAAFFVQVSQLDPGLLKLGVTIALVTAAVGPILWLLGSMLSPIGLLVGAVVGLATAFATNFGGIRDKVSEVVTDVLGDLNPLIDSVENFLNTLFDEDFDFNGNNIVTAVQGGVANAVSVLQGAPPVTLNIPIEAGTTLSGIYYSSEFATDLQNNFTYDEFIGVALEALGASDPRFIAAGSMLNIELGSSIQLQNAGVERGQYDVWADGVTGEIQRSFGERLQLAFETAWPGISQALAGVFNSIITWITETGIPLLDGLGADIMGAITGLFSVGDANFEGDGPLYGFLRTIFGGGLEQAGSDLGTWFSENFPEFTASIGTFFNNLGTWITAEGIPTLARAFGYLFGTVIAGAMVALPDMIFNLMSGVNNVGPIDGSGIVSGIQTSLLDPLVSGVQDAGNDVFSNSASFSFIYNFFTLFGDEIARAIQGIGPAIDAGWRRLGRDIKLGMLNMIREVFEDLPVLLEVFKVINPAAASILEQQMALVPQMIAQYDVANAIEDALSKNLEGSDLTLALDGLTLALGDTTDLITAENIAKELTPQAITQLKDRIKELVLQAAGGDVNAQNALQILLPVAVQAGIGTDDVITGPIEGGFKQMLMDQIATFADDPMLTQTALDRITAFWTDVMEQPITMPEGPAPSVGDGTAPITALNEGFAGIRVPIAPPTDADVQGVMTNIAAGVTAAASGKTSTLRLAGSSISKSMAEGMKNMATTSFGAGGTGDIDQPIKGMVNRVTGTFLTAFNPGSMALTAFMGFKNAITTQTIDMTNRLDRVATSATNARNGITNAFVNLWPVISSAVAGMTSGFNTLANSLAAVAREANAAAAALLNATGQGYSPTGTQPQDTLPSSGPFASGGNVIPNTWSVVGERGPEVVFWGNNGTVMPTRLLRDGMGGGTSSSGGNNIYVSGVQNVDELLYELRRRGIVLNG